MRLCHKDLVPYLPKLQMLSQYRELVAIIKRIDKQGTPNHILVNKILNYEVDDFRYYSKIVVNCLKERGYKINEKTWENFNELLTNNSWRFALPTRKDLFYDWHNKRYLKQCLFNLQEKHDCCGISDEEWKIIEDKFGYLLEDD